MRITKNPRTVKALRSMKKRLCTAGHEIFIACPKEIMFDNHTEIVGLAAGICTSVSLLPQLIKLVKHKKAEDISLFYLIILFIGLGLWIWYGVLRDDIPILVTNGFSLVINGIVIVLGIRYKRSHKGKLNSCRGPNAVEFE